MSVGMFQVQKVEENPQYTKFLVGHNYVGHDYIDRKHIGHDYIGHSHVGHNSIGR